MDEAFKTVIKSSENVIKFICAKLWCYHLMGEVHGSNINTNANRKKKEKLSIVGDDDELVTYEWTGNYVIPHPPDALEFP